ncbi:GDP-mannose 4,6-dehydratase [Candidatus Methylomirabilis sp.]|uniref:GDP-mannose 4,6-dehydratase n=1 Tax=Candidatus Methylomirabilis sp. TaxID=2032687 RepID=UPI002A657BCC|nr:GDP-mannose 4,6-dehydratase [Candidatus Methylomirabilis sp.]
MKTALITGITGQDGSYLTELLLAKGYTVHGLIRRASTFQTQRIEHLYQDPHDPQTRLVLHYGDLSDSSQLTNLFYEVRPDEVYHLGAQSHVRVSFDMPDYTGDITGLGTVRLLEAIRRSGVRCRLYQASSSEMFGDAPAPQNEQSSFQPRSPYAAAKLYAYWMVRNYREGYGLFACNGIMFNHESPRRGETFVSRKITRAVSAILAGRQQKLFLGNLDARRDWGYAPEYVEGMWLMLQQKAPCDLVFGTGETHSVLEFVEEAFGYVNLDWREYVAEDPRYLRPTEVPLLRADPSEAKRRLGWEPGVRFRDLVRIMMDADIEAAGLPAPEKGKRCPTDGRLAWLQRP